LAQQRTQPLIGELLSIATPFPSSALDAAGVLHELRLLVDAVGADAASRLHLMMSPTVAGRLATMPTTNGDNAFPGMAVNGGSLANVPVHTSDAAEDNVILADAARIVGASENVELRASNAASLEMVDSTSQAINDGASPLAVSSVIAASVVSMFQTNATALKAERRFGFTRCRGSAYERAMGPVRIAAGVRISSNEAVRD
jgi:Phage capsid family